MTDIGAVIQSRFSAEAALYDYLSNPARFRSASG